MPTNREIQAELVRRMRSEAKWFANVGDVINSQADPEVCAAQRLAYETCARWVEQAPFTDAPDNPNKTAEGQREKGAGEKS